MAEQTSNGRIEELKARLAADPESRVFYQLGEELRKHGHPAEAEDVLRKGLATHPAYLSAWISLGRVLQDSNRPAEAVDVLARAFEIDRQNVVVARLLGDSYRAMGEDIEAIKKYKLVAALHPADEEVHEVIKEIATRLASAEDPGAVQEPAADPPGSPPEPDPALAEESWSESTEAETAEEPSGSVEIVAGDVRQELHGDGMEEDLQPPFPLETSEDDVVATVTMGDLYARQGHLEQAREIYRRILERDPGNAEASGRLELLGEADDQEISPTRAKVVRLEQWLSRIRN
jgi:tetratricopeptide (TPR) repeat protein